MTLSDLYQRVNLKLGEQSLFYPVGEIVRQGLSPAQRLLCLASPMVLQERALVTLLPEQPFIDLRTVSTRIRKIRRVVIGDITGNAPVVNASTGEYLDLIPTTLGRLASQDDWFSQRGKLKNYWRWGAYWFGVYKRPFETFTLTLMFDATPTPLDETTMDQVPDIAAIHHLRIADIAVGLLLLKEGPPQTARGMEWIMRGLNMQQPVTT
jgi:hypothetical protein